MIKKIFLFLSFITASVQLFCMEPNHALVPRGQRQRAAHQDNAEQIKELWLACKNGDEAKAAQLLQAGVSANTRLFFGAPLDEEGCDDTTYLHYAASGGHLNIVDLLFAHRAHTNPRDQNGWIPLISALAMGHEAVVDRLIARGAQVNSIDAFLGHRPIATPVQCLNPRLVSMLLKAGAVVIPPIMTFHNNVPLQVIYQGSALHILCERLQHRPLYTPEYDTQETEDRALEIIEIVRAHGINMSHQDINNNTVFHAAARLNDRRIMAALMVSTNYTKPIRQAALATLKALLLVNQRTVSNGSVSAVLPQEVVFRIFSHMPIECKQAGITSLIVPHCTTAVAMRTRYLDACLADLKKHSWHTVLADLKKHSWHTVPEVQTLLKVLGILNSAQKQACDLTQDAYLQNVLNPICWY